MNIEVIVHKDEYETPHGVEIQVDEKIEFDIHAGEPEDNTLYRNFNDCLFVHKLMKLAYEAGKRGEDFVIVETER